MPMMERAERKRLAYSAIVFLLCTLWLALSRAFFRRRRVGHAAGYNYSYDRNTVSGFFIGFLADEGDANNSFAPTSSSSSFFRTYACILCLLTVLVAYERGFFHLLRAVVPAGF
ncbi:unnamed protein product [Amoebophrya sp. A120]|nr:unnamed protein product [Amoebophrya sp. A120]|eukprot:GSA120T00003094001.1